MAIKFYCVCGKKLKAAADQAGRTGQCTACGRALVVPGEASSGADTPAVARDSAPLVDPWYYAHQGQMLGPFAGNELRALALAGQLRSDDWVLPPGAADWIAARDVPGLLLSPTIPGPTPAIVEPTLLGTQFFSRLDVLAEAQVVPDASRCVQCGICSHNCPMGIDVRAHARRGRPIHDSRCLTCSECVNRCPRGVLQFEWLSLLGVET